MTVPFDLATHLVTIDFETFWDTDYTLRTMPPLEYVRDHRFEIILVAIQIDDHPVASVSDPRRIDTLFAGIPWEKCAVMGHNLAFDGTILVDKFGINPALWIDTLAMANAEIKPFTGSSSLDSVSKHLKLKGGHLPAKGSFTNLSKGLRRRQMDANFLKEFSEYAKDDVTITRNAYEHMRDAFSLDEIKLIDRTVRMQVNPTLRLNANVLYNHQMAVLAAQEKAREAAKMDRDTLMSNEKFADELRAHGVVPPMKISPTTGKQTYAFAKKDEAFMDLLDHPDPAVGALVSARLSNKSTIASTRAKRLYDLAMSCGVLPAPLAYCSAHTTRYGGCLIGATCVTVLRDGDMQESRLDHVQENDLVWDGSEFVRHGGLVFSGWRDVITHDGITGTPCHPIWTGERSGYVGLEEAAQRGLHAVLGGIPDPTRIEASVRGAGGKERPRALHVPNLRPRDAVAVEGRPCAKDASVQELQAAGTDGGRAGPNASDGSRAPHQYEASGMAQHSSYIEGGEIALYEEDGPRVEELRGARDRVQVLISQRDDKVGIGNTGSTPRWYDTRPDRQRRALRTGQSTLGDYTGTGGQSSRLSRVAPTFDLLDCGPRSRFVANGRIVHNSGKFNLQNLQNGSPIKAAIEAEPGHDLVNADAKQIEARVAAKLFGQKDKVAQFARGEDVYSITATGLFGYTVDKTLNRERQVGKVADLQLQFLAGPTGFLAHVRSSGIDMSEDEARDRVKAWRRQNAKIYNGGMALKDEFLSVATSRHNVRRPHKSFWFYLGKDIAKDNTAYIEFQNGLRIYYPEVRKATDKFDNHYWGFTRNAGRTPASQYFETFKPQMIVNNAVQGLARTITMRHAVILTDYPITRWVLTVHDSLVFHPRKEHTERVMKAAELVMSKPPWWCPGLPLAADVSCGANYGACK